MKLYSEIMRIKNSPCKGYWQERISAELIFLYNLSMEKGLFLEEELCPAVSALVDALLEKGAITKSDVLSCEETLAELSPIAKQYTGHLVAHAHMDMNWMWGYQETVSLTLSTLRTMLSFLREYPSFTFSQSQASVYEIVDKYAPEMLSEIKDFIKEGRWEVSAGTWVEHDKNMSGTEMQLRQVLESKRYLSALLDIPPESLDIDFEPDTFGHGDGTVEILSKCGIKYYYHCRGNCENTLYNWVAPSGESLLCYRDPKWYNDGIDPYIFSDMPIPVCKTGTTHMLTVYGVGDHGGGPTRRDIELAIDMMDWPLYPKIEFSTYKRFFNEVEKDRDSFPAISGEQNYIFTGCYSSQSKLKSANALSEAAIYSGECATALASAFAGLPLKKEAYTNAIRNTLFNQFHDILPGSGTDMTREYSMGLFQESMAKINSETFKAIEAISLATDTSSIETLPEEISESEGAGAGYFADPERGFAPSGADRGSGKVRILQFFNTTSNFRKTVEKAVIFDYSGDLSRLSVKDSEGNSVPFVLGETGRHYWRHYITELYIEVLVPPFGYETYTVYEKDEDKKSSFRADVNPRLHSFGDTGAVLENDLVCAVFDPVSYALSSFTDKRTGKQLCTNGAFELIEETLRRGESSWAVGQYMSKKSLHRDYKRKFLEFYKNDILSVFRYEVYFENSRMTVTQTLKNGSTVVETLCETDWLEGKYTPNSVPQLRFALEMGEKPESFVYAAPSGNIERPSLCHDVPSLGYAFANGLCIVCPEKYGYRGHNSTLSLTLLRSSSDPDPYPELGRHRISFCFGAANDPAEAYNIWESKRNPLIQHFATRHGGTLPLKHSFFEVEGAKVISVFKRDDRIVLRLLAPDEKGNTATVKCADVPLKVFKCPAFGKEKIELCRGIDTVCLSTHPKEILTLELLFKSSNKDEKEG